MKEAETLIPLLPEEPVFVIQTNLGTMKVKLYSKTPKHRENFERLALTGYYDGLLFHRIINGFMIQGGDPLTRDETQAARYGTGGPDYTIPAEFIPEYTHKKGALAAARRGDAANPMKESSGSQFYLVQNEAACASLNGDYSVFGETIEGLDVIDKIAAVQTNERDLPINPVKIISVTLDPASRPAAAE
ncbi:MAG: peptidylprolyl isomerase [Bacteroidales bacterium]|nr:peptidylprolyl isomerase [Bacteroidales bacterium]